MKEISPIMPTFWDRGENGELLADTYHKARTKHYFIATDYNYSPLLSNYTSPITPDLAELVTWVSKHILIKIDILNSKSIAVLTRIATSKLNKIERCVSKDDKISIHLNLIQSIKWLKTEYIVANLRNNPNELPF